MARVTRAIGSDEEADVGERGDAGHRWQLRTVPEDRARRYRDEGWWTDQTLGEMVDAGLGRIGDLPFRVRSAVHPWRGTFADVDRSARALAGALAADGVGPGDVVVFQLPNWVEAGITFWAAAYLGAVVVPVVHFYGPKEVDVHPPDDRRRRSWSPPTASATTTTWRTTGSSCPSRPEARWLVVGGTPGDDLPPGAVPFESFLGADPLAAPAARRPGRAGDHRLHLGHHPRPEGGHPLAPDHRVRDPPARPHVPHRAGRR